MKQFSQCNNQTLQPITRRVMKNSLSAPFAPNSHLKKKHPILTFAKNGYFFCLVMNTLGTDWGIYPHQA